MGYLLILVYAVIFVFRKQIACVVFGSMLFIGLMFFFHKSGMTFYQYSRQSFFLIKENIKEFCEMPLYDAYHKKFRNVRRHRRSIY